MLGWVWCGFHKKHTRTRYAELVFLHPVEFAGHVVQSSASGRKTLMHSFSCPGGFYKMRVGTRYAERMFLHSVGAAGHIVHFAKSGERNINTLFFVLG
jgi:hypothetical protein